MDSNNIEEMSIVGGADIFCQFFSIFIIHHQTLLTNIAGVTGSKDNVDEDALNKELDERLDDRLNHVQ